VRDNRYDGKYVKGPFFLALVFIVASCAEATGKTETRATLRALRLCYGTHKQL